MDDIFEHHESPFRGEPRPELDAAWQRLMRGKLPIAEQAFCRFQCLSSSLY